MLHLSPHLIRRTPDGVFAYYPNGRFSAGRVLPPGLPLPPLLRALGREDRLMAYGLALGILLSSFWESQWVAIAGLLLGAFVRQLRIQNQTAHWSISHFGFEQAQAVPSLQEVLRAELRALPVPGIARFAVQLVAFAAIAGFLVATELAQMRNGAPVPVFGWILGVFALTLFTAWSFPVGKPRYASAAILGLMLIGHRGWVERMMESPAACPSVFAHALPLFSSSGNGDGSEFSRQDFALRFCAKGRFSSRLGRALSDGSDLSRRLQLAGAMTQLFNSGTGMPLEAQLGLIDALAPLERSSVSAFERLAISAFVLEEGEKLELGLSAEERAKNEAYRQFNDKRVVESGEIFQEADRELERFRALSEGKLPESLEPLERRMLEWRSAAAPKSGGTVFNLPRGPKRVPAAD